MQKEEDVIPTQDIDDFAAKMEKLRVKTEREMKKRQRD
jgi:hypothetical protein